MKLAHIFMGNVFRKYLSSLGGLSPKFKLFLIYQPTSIYPKPNMMSLTFFSSFFSWLNKICVLRERSNIFFSSNKKKHYMLRAIKNSFIEMKWNPNDREIRFVIHSLLYSLHCLIFVSEMSILGYSFFLNMTCYWNTLNT